MSDIAPITSQLIVISDVHIRQPDDRRFSLLMQVLACIDKSSVEFLVLNGDIFDFFYAGSKFFREQYAPLLTLLTKLSADGVKVIFTEGNHEIGLRRAPITGVWCTDAKDLQIQLSTGEKVAISHGDLLKHDPGYFALRKFLKSGWLFWLGKLIPGRWLNWFALNWATVSRSQDQYRSIDHQMILASAKKWIERSGALHGVFGHFHIPYEEKWESVGKVVSVNSWDKPNILEYQNGVFSRRFF